LMAFILSKICVTVNGIDLERAIIEKNREGSRKHTQSPNL